MINLNIAQAKPISRGDTFLLVSSRQAALVRAFDQADLMVVPQAALSTDRLRHAGYSNPHAALYDAYAEAFDRAFLANLKIGDPQ